MKPKTKTERLDKLLVERGLVSTRSRAQAMIIAGKVLVEDQPSVKAGALIEVDAQIRLREPELKYVSRSALKLKAAIETFNIDVKNVIAVDIGSSTGGFTEILLECGASRVFAVDVGTNQLAWKIRSDPRVTSMENTNARNLGIENFGMLMDMGVMDVSFISIRLILPAIQKILKKNAPVIVLFKPQFEVGREWIEEGGIVKNQEVAQSVMRETMQWAEETLGFSVKGMIPSPIQGTDGNQEYLIYWINP